MQQGGVLVRVLEIVIATTLKSSPPLLNNGQAETGGLGCREALT